MPHLLHLDASPRPNGFSRTLGRLFADTWRERHGGEYTYRDLVAQPVPFITHGWTELCDEVLAQQITDVERLSEAARTPAQREAWAVVEPLLAELVAADVVLIATPMHNYSVPAPLKAWLDQVTFPKISLAGRRFVITAARGGAYGPGTPKEPYEHQERYLRHFIAGHFGVEDVEFIAVELTNSLVDPLLEQHRAAHEASLERARAEVVKAAELGTLAGQAVAR